MLEADGVLATWELAALPAVWAEKLKVAQHALESPILATRLTDHRLAYLDYEGLVSGNRGTVVRIASGSFEQEKFNKEAVVANLQGDQLQGRIKLTRVAKSDRWELALDQP